ncbi:MAG: hypothetical protein UV98_C0024G0011 [Parcubacteria group bacterium GW2011_GWB1_43_6]|nr:MAG: hypothetical protein UV98_C0024G0011 [Parcubacteria group bacterium GW2011_GWB1_43_6]
MVTAFLRQIWRTVSLLVQVALFGATAAAGWAAPYAGAYLAALAGTTALWLFLILGFTLAKAITGYLVLGYVGAFLAVLLTLLLGVMWAPLAVLVGTLHGVTYPPPALITHDPRVVGERYVRFVGTLLFGELLFSLYVLAVPFHQNLGLLPVLIIASAATGVGSLLYGGWLGGRFYTAVALSVAALLTLEMFSPGVLVMLSGHLVAVFQGGATPAAVYWILIPVFFAAGFVRKYIPFPLVKGVAAGVQLLVAMALVQWFVAGTGANVIEKYASKPVAAPGAYTRGTRFNLPELCPDPDLYRRLNQGEVVDWELGDRSGCNAEHFKVESGEVEVVLVYGSGGTVGPLVWSPTTPNFTFKERKMAISLKAVTPVVTYRAFQ